MILEMKNVSKYQTIKVFNPENIEKCVKTKMEKYATMKKKL
jgi:hypothetical protein